MKPASIILSVILSSVMVAGCDLIMPLSESGATRGLSATGRELVSALVVGVDAHRGLGFAHQSACTAGGGIDIASEVRWQDVEAVLSAQLTGCSDGEVVVDGSIDLTLSASLAGGHLTGSASGELWFDDAVRGWCAIDVSVHIGAGGVRYTGTLCGHDAAALGTALLGDLVDELDNALPWP